MLKVDIQKAYDSVSWSFLKEALHAFNFPSKFVHLVMVCVQSASFSVSLNGCHHGYFKGEKGLRQGDPMSHILFVLCMEVLSRMLTRAKEEKIFDDHPMCGRLKITHLCFVDDLMMFLRGDVPSATRLVQTFNTFANTSGLKENINKSYFYFAGVHEDVRKQILQETKFSEGKLPFRYLGVPLTAARLILAIVSATP